MLNEYDEVTAEHYSAYRPKLHSLILKDNLDKQEYFNLGLDIGCGTGNSSIALSKFCKKVVGIDPIDAMLAKAIKDQKVLYRSMPPNLLEFNNNLFDVVTFAGSLYYAKSQRLLDEIVRISLPKAKIIVYDFDVVLEDILNHLELYTHLNHISRYNHQANFSSLNSSRVEIMESNKKEYKIDINISELTHLLLSAKDTYRFLKFRYADDIYNKTKQQLALKFKSTTLTAESYYIKYIVLK